MPLSRQFIEPLEKRSLLSVAAPTGLMGRSPDTGGVRIMWSNHATDATAIKVDRATSATGPWTVLRSNLPPDYETYYDTTAKSAHNFFYAVIAAKGATASPAAVSRSFRASSYDNPNTIQYGVSAGPDPNQNTANTQLLTDAGAKAIRIYSGTTYNIARDFGTANGKIYLLNTAFSGDPTNLLHVALQRAKQYHSQGLKVTLWIQLYTDRTPDGAKIPNGGSLSPDQLLTPAQFKQWYTMLSQAQIDKNDPTKVIDVVDAFEIGNEPNLLKNQYWPAAKLFSPKESEDRQIADTVNSYIDHDLVPAYSVFSKIGKTVVGAGLAGAKAKNYAALNGTDDPSSSRYLQYSMNCDLMNFHPYGTYENDPDNPTQTINTSAAKEDAFLDQMYADPNVKNKSVITEFNLHDLVDKPTLSNPDPAVSSQNAARETYISQLNIAQQHLASSPIAQQKLSTVFYFTLLAAKDARDTHNAGLVYQTPSSTTYETTLFYEMFELWTGV